MQEEPPKGESELSRECYTTDQFRMFQFKVRQWLLPDFAISMELCVEAFLVHRWWCVDETGSVGSARWLPVCGRGVPGGGAEQWGGRAPRVGAGGRYQSRQCASQVSGQAGLPPFPPHLMESPPGSILWMALTLVPLRDSSWSQIDACPHLEEMHDWTHCPFQHPGEKARRRDPNKHRYQGVPCPDYRKVG